MAIVECISLPTSELPLSGLRCLPEAQNPVGLIVALHGGSYTAGYWHAESLPESSLLLLGASLGYTVLAPDRPGYGSSTAWPRERQRLAFQAEAVFDIIEDFVAGQPALQGKPVFVIGHSMGGMLALMMGANARATRLSGIDVSGVPLRFPPGMQELIDQQAASASSAPFLPKRPAQEMQGIFYGPPETYWPQALAHDAAIHARVPSPEMFDAAGCPTELPPLMQKITVPVQLTIPALEKSSMGGQESLDYARQFLSNSRRVVTHLQQGSGHNISLHKVARAYHLRAIAFFEECRHLPA
jgi:pimeloyl-ACP methyl ester carboxylesterase